MAPRFDGGASEPAFGGASGGGAGARVSADAAGRAAETAADASAALATWALVTGATLAPRERAAHRPPSASPRAMAPTMAIPSSGRAGGADGSDAGKGIAPGSFHAASSAAVGGLGGASLRTVGECRESGFAPGARRALFRSTALIRLRGVGALVGPTDAGASLAPPEP